jgi:rhomboid protease GluP
VARQRTILLPDEGAGEPAQRIVRHNARSIPWTTIGLVVLLGAIFALEVHFTVVPGAARFNIAPATMLALGGIEREMVLDQHEYYRLRTAAFLHANREHLIGNGIGILWSGYILERHIGHRWFLALFLIGAVSGAAASVAVMPPHAILVGASGGALALFTALFFCSLRMPTSRARLFTQGRAIVMVILSVVPSAVHPQGISVSYTSHIGGAIAGLIVILIIAACWRDGEDLPRGRWFAGGISMIAFAVMALGIRGTVANYSAFWVAGSMIPNAVLPRTEAEQNDLAPALLARYPSDPRSHMFMARSLQMRHDKIGAEREYRAAFALIQTHPDMFGQPFGDTVRAMLAQAINDNGQHGAARDLAQTLCTNPSMDPRQLGTLKRLKLCD